MKGDNFKHEWYKTIRRIGWEKRNKFFNNNTFFNKLQKKLPFFNSFYSNNFSNCSTYLFIKKYSNTSFSTHALSTFAVSLAKPNIHLTSRWQSSSISSSDMFGGFVDGWEEAVGGSDGGVLSKIFLLPFIIFLTKIFASSVFPFDLAFFIKKLFFSFDCFN